MNKLWAMYFSGTGGTEKVTKSIAETIGSKLNIHNIEVLDFTPLKNRKEVPVFEKEDIVVLGLPTIAGRVPNLMLEYLKKIQGNAAVGIAVMTFGNRSFDDSLMELSLIMDDCNFRVIAGGGFSCEHSFSTILGKGRPDAEDMEEVVEFGRKIAEKIKNNDFSRPTVKGNNPVHPYFQPQDRNGNHIDIRKVKPKTNDKCTDCKLCAILCPTGAIDYNDVKSVPGVCMKCCACVKKCPVNAKYFDDEVYLYHQRELEELYGVRRAINEYFV